MSSKFKRGMGIILAQIMAAAILSVCPVQANIVQVQAGEVMSTQVYNERITPNKLTIQREDGSKVTIDAFRIRGYNVAQLRTLVQACGGSVTNVVNDVGYQIINQPGNTPFTPVSFSGAVTVKVQFNVTGIMDKTGKYIRPGEPGWVFLTDYNYNWGSIRDVLTAMGYEIKSFTDDAGNATTSVVIGQIVKTAPGKKEFPTPSGFVGTCPVYIYYEDNLKPSIPNSYTINNFTDPDHSGEKIWIYARDGVKEIRVYRIDYNFNSSSYTVSVNKQLYTAKLTSNDVLVIDTMIPDTVPLTAVTFIGNDGKAHSFLLCSDGRTGLSNALAVDLKEFND